MAIFFLTKTSAFQYSDDQIERELPIRSELFSAERLEQFAGSLAGEHTEVDQPKQFQKLLSRLEANGQVLLAAYKSLVGAITNERAISPPAEWLVDNFHIV